MALIEDGPFFWGADWVCSLPLIVLNVAAHVSALSLIGMHVDRLGENAARRRGSRYVLTARLSFITLLVILLHGAEAAVWAVIYVILGAVSGPKAAMLYSLGAMTSYGHAPILLMPEWQLMGALEALTGLLLMGLTTAFLYAMIKQVRAFQSRQNEWDSP
jgi:hypothetical protein